MNVTLLLEMAAESIPDRVVLGTRRAGWTADELASGARRIGAWLAGLQGERVGMIDLNSDAVPLCLFGSAFSGKAFVPMNYRLADDQLRALLARTAPAAVVVGDGVADRLGRVEGVRYIDRTEVFARAADAAAPRCGPGGGNPDAIALLLYTSGTSGLPKVAVLRHRNLTSYVITTVEFAGAAEDEAALVSVPPYHVAGIASVLSSTYAGRRVVYMEQFDAAAWVETVRREGITQAMVVPTMLGRILSVLDSDGAGLPGLRSLSYGGGPMPVTVIERALELLPHVDFVNAYGLTETSSTISLLGPDEHRRAASSEVPAVRRRLGSVGRPLPTVSVSIRGPIGEELGIDEEGEIWVRGDQVSGEYLDAGRDGDEWFRTRDAGHVDEFGFLYLHGRLDDVIVRGGENLSPAEIEGALLAHPAVVAAVAVGVPDAEWGERLVAAVVLDDGAEVSEEELRAFVRSSLRSSHTPERIQIRAELPYNEMGKLLRRSVRQELAVVFARE